jgi:hypothetical protein
VGCVLNSINNLILGPVSLTQLATLKKASNALRVDSSLQSSVSWAAVDALQMRTKKMVNDVASQSFGGVVGEAPTRHLQPCIAEGTKGLNHTSNWVDFAVNWQLASSASFLMAIPNRRSCQTLLDLLISDPSADR